MAHSSHRPETREHLGRSVRELHRRVIPSTPLPQPFDARVSDVVEVCGIRRYDDAPGHGWFEVHPVQHARVLARKKKGTRRRTRHGRTARRWPAGCRARWSQGRNADGRRGHREAAPAAAGRSKRAGAPAALAGRSGRDNEERKNKLLVPSSSFVVVTARRSPRTPASGMKRPSRRGSPSLFPARAAARRSLRR